MALTEKDARNAPAPEKGATVLWDDKVAGFGLRISQGGTKSFILNYRAQGRERRMTLGRFPTWSVGKARDEAARIRRIVDAGEDPMAQRHANREAPTLEDVWKRYKRDYLPNNRPSTRVSYENIWKLHIQPSIGKLKAAAVTGNDVEGMHRKIAKKAPYRANRAVALLSRMFNLARRWGWVADNPCRGVERTPERKRARYLSPEELTRLMGALADFPYLERVRKTGTGSRLRRRQEPRRDRLQSANAIRLLILTGARRNEVLSARWEQFDLATGIWIKPGATTKQKTDHRVPLSSATVELLKGMKESNTGPWLFPSESGHQKDLKYAWRSICRNADLEGVRLHDLRHSYASLLASQGMSLPVIGALLGHTQAATTARYAHLLDDPLRRATENAGVFLGELQNARK